MGAGLADRSDFDCTIFCTLLPAADGQLPRLPPVADAAAIVGLTGSDNTIMIRVFCTLRAAVRDRVVQSASVAGLLSAGKGSALIWNP